MLKYESLPRVLMQHAINQVREVVEVGFVCLSAYLYKLDLLATVGADTDGTGQVVC